MTYTQNHDRIERVRRGRLSMCVRNLFVITEMMLLCGFKVNRTRSRHNDLLFFLFSLSLFISRQSNYSQHELMRWSNNKIEPQWHRQRSISERLLENSDFAAVWGERNKDEKRLYKKWEWVGTNLYLNLSDIPDGWMRTRLISSLFNSLDLSEIFCCTRQKSLCFVFVNSNLFFFYFSLK